MAIRPAGVTATTGPYVRYPEFTPPRPANTGFNPSDKVETRVARLYYFRDAHRVAQIINRKVRSYNRASVESSRQQADKARGVAEDASAKRQKAERDAVAKAQLTRQKERQLATVEQSRERTLELIRDA
ncbi:MAG TPA: hypothetical protein PLV92_30255, partial [Pirellulaceae bacterium]|nr:hypothetical protein [Pirellulaceae bacterium]